MLSSQLVLAGGWYAVRPIQQALGNTESFSCLISFVCVGGFSLSYHELKRPVGLLSGFGYTIASAPSGFL